jgi:hypothetical protein
MNNPGQKRRRLAVGGEQDVPTLTLVSGKVVQPVEKQRTVLNP